MAAITRVTQPPTSTILIAKVNAFATAYPTQFARILAVLTSRGY